MTLQLKVKIEDHKLLTNYVPLLNIVQKKRGARWLSGKVLYSRPRGCGPSGGGGGGGGTLLFSYICRFGPFFGGFKILNFNYFFFYLFIYFYFIFFFFLGGGGVGGQTSEYF